MERVVAAIGTAASPSASGSLVRVWWGCGDMGPEAFLILDPAAEAGSLYVFASRGSEEQFARLREAFEVDWIRDRVARLATNDVDWSRLSSTLLECRLRELPGGGECEVFGRKALVVEVVGPTPRAVSLPLSPRPTWAQ